MTEKSSSVVTGNDGVAVDEVPIRLTEDDILGLHVLASLDGVADTDSDAFLDRELYFARRRDGPFGKGGAAVAADS